MHYSLWLVVLSKSDRVLQVNILSFVMQFVLISLVLLSDAELKRHVAIISV
jgi:hypothetical protein